MPGGIKGHKTNLAATPDGEPVAADFVISSYHELWRIEKSFRMSKSDLRARPIYHRDQLGVDLRRRLLAWGMPEPDRPTLNVLADRWFATE